MVDIYVMIGVLVFVILFLAGLIVYHQYLHMRRERDFLNRFMARDFMEYTRGTANLKRPMPVEDAIDGLLDELGDAQEEVVRVG